MLWILGWACLHPPLQSRQERRLLESWAPPEGQPLVLLYAGQSTPVGSCWSAPEPWRVGLQPPVLPAQEYLPPYLLWAWMGEIPDPATPYVVGCPYRLESGCGWVTDAMGPKGRWFADRESAEIAAAAMPPCASLTTD